VYRRTRLGVLAVAASAILLLTQAPALAAPDRPGSGVVPGLSIPQDAVGSDGTKRRVLVPASKFPDVSAPVDPKERRAWEDAPKQQHYTINADTVTQNKAAPFKSAKERNTAQTSNGKLADSGDNNIIAHDPVTLDECQNHEFEGHEKPYWHKNKYSTCFEGTYTILRPPTCPILCGPTQVNFNLWVIGVGYINYTRDGVIRKVQWSIRTKPAYADSGFNMNLPVKLDFHCTTGVADQCNMSPSAGHTKTLGEWHRGIEAHTDMTVTGSGWEDDPYEIEDRTYHTVKFTFTQPDPTLEPPTVTSPTDSVRCDVAEYNYYIGTRAYSNGACVFTNVDSWIAYQRSSERHGEVAKHIYDAQYRAVEFTKPGVVGGIIPGSRQSGLKLHRLVPAFSAENEQFHSRNNAIAVATCVQYWPPDYTEGNTKECDEYPFATTHEGAAYNERNGGATAYSYSARPVAASHNGSAGGSLNYWYVRDHVIEGDGFYVVIED
jgi:hypothetical protein